VGLGESSCEFQKNRARFFNIKVNIFVYEKAIRKRTNHWYTRICPGCGAAGRNRTGTRFKSRRILSQKQPKPLSCLACAI